jgi:hypothetical protein
VPAKFHERFKIKVDVDEARRRFVNRVHNIIFENFLFEHFEYQQVEIERAILTHLGDRALGSTRPLPDKIGADFHRNLEAVEGFYGIIQPSSHELDGIIVQLIDTAEVDLGIGWRDGQFVPSGAKILDKQIVNDVLDWLRRPGFENVLGPFEKGLGHLLRARKNPAQLADVVTDMYESLEAMAKIVTARPDKDLSANRELFVHKVEASDEYKPILKDYVEYACRFRHAASGSRPKPKLSAKEVESFVYLTGLFLRLAMP